VDASIDENLQFMYDSFGELLGVTAIKQKGLYIGIEGIMWLNSR